MGEPTPEEKPVPSEVRSLIEHAKAEVRKELIKKFVAGLIGGGIALFGFAAAGWWLYLQPKIIEIVGGLPESAVVAFDATNLDEDHCPPGWLPFLYARGRTLVGAGDPAKAPLKMGYDQNHHSLKGYLIRQHGGEQFHKLFGDELPFKSETKNVAPCSGEKCAKIESISYPNVTEMDRAENFGQEFNVMPPFVAVYYCRKK